MGVALMVFACVALLVVGPLCVWWGTWMILEFRSSLLVLVGACLLFFLGVAAMFVSVLKLVSLYVA